MNRHPMLQGRKTIKFHRHPEGWTCETCKWIEAHEESKRGHYEYYCRALPVPAKIAYELSDYWCGQHREKETE